MSDLIGASAVDLTAGIADGTVSAVDLMRATLSRIDVRNSDLNAIVALEDREALMGAARVAEATPPIGPLHGLPIAVKDLVAVRGMVSTWGSPLLAQNRPCADDGLARRLRVAGALIIGKTNVPEFGLGSHTVNPVYGATRNPFDPMRTAGGSSGGAAAALASGMVSLADGSDMMGSLRNPAAWCDVWGFRPTVGVVPGDSGDRVLLHRLSTAGPMARSITDLTLLLSVLSDGAIPAIAPVPRETPARIAWLGDWGGAYAMDPDLLGAGETALARAQDIGWHIDAIAPPFPASDLWQSWTDLRSFVVAQELAAYWHAPDHRKLLNRQAQWEVARGLRLTGEDIENASAKRLAWLACLETLFECYDALVLPATQCWPFPVTWDWPQEIAGQGMDTYHRWMEIVVPASLAGLPAICLPAGYGATGLPHGLQMIGPRGADTDVLALAVAWEDVVGPRSIH